MLKKGYILIISFTILMACNSSQTSSEDNTDTQEEAEEALPEGRVFFKNISNGDTLTSPFLIEMGVEGMTVEPKGEPKNGVGHHHLLINDGAIDKGMVIVADSTHIHYGGGQESDSVALNPGNYKLTLQFADGMHVSYGTDWSNTVNVVVK